MENGREDHLSDTLEALGREWRSWTNKELTKDEEKRLTGGATFYVLSDKYVLTGVAPTWIYAAAAGLAGFLFFGSGINYLIHDSDFWGFVLVIIAPIVSAIIGLRVYHSLWNGRLVNGTWHHPKKVLLATLHIATLLVALGATMVIQRIQDAKDATEGAAYLAEYGSKTVDGFAIIQTQSKNAIIISKYVGEGGDVVIPAEFDGLPVVVISSDAFERSSITSVTIPSGSTINYGSYSSGGQNGAYIDSIKQERDSSNYFVADQDYVGTVTAGRKSHFKGCISLSAASVQALKNSGYIGELVDPAVRQAEVARLTQGTNPANAETIKQQIVGTWTDIEGTKWSFTGDGKLTCENSPDDILKFQYTITGTKLTFAVTKNEPQSYDIYISSDGKTLILINGTSYTQTWEVAGPGWGENRLTRK